jgi:hypothetical protein
MADIPHDESGKKQLFRELTAGMTAQWQQENIENHETLWVGPGIHLLQEENPEADTCAIGTCELTTREEIY